MILYGQFDCGIEIFKTEDLLKLTVLQWEKVQDGLRNLPSDDAMAEKLFDKIEHRTYGKRYQAGCSISLTKGRANHGRRHRLRARESGAIQRHEVRLMRVYLASRWERGPEMRQYRDELAEMGVMVVEPLVR